jgi:Family of unknown function (DUF5681)
MSADEEVGYQKPPTKHQFKKGQSGNPKGRPKGSKNMKTMFEEVLRQPVVVRQGDRQKSVPTMQAAVMAMTTQAMRGNTKAFELVLKGADKCQLLASTPSGQQGGADKPSGFAWTAEHESLRPFIEHLLNGDKPVIDE